MPKSVRASHWRALPRMRRNSETASVQRGPALLVEALDDGVRGECGQICQRGAAPQRQRSGVRGRRRGPVAAGGRLSARHAVRGELPQVELVRRDLDQMSGRRRLDAPGVRVAEILPQPGDLVVRPGAAAAGRVRGPEQLGQVVGGHDRARVQQQFGQQGAAQRAADLHCGAVLARDVQRARDPAVRTAPRAPSPVGRSG